MIHFSFLEMGGVSLHSFGCPGTNFVDWDGLELTKNHLLLPPEYVFLNPAYIISSYKCHI